VTVTLLELEAARHDAAVFADRLLGEALWEHQLEVVRSPARYRVICAGRRAGKTRVFGVLALHQAVAVPRSKVLIISAGEVAAKRMFQDIAEMAARAPLVAASVDDETKSMLVLNNRSTIECVPASMAQVRSAEADLLIVDEAGFVPQEIWQAAEPTIAARPGSKVLLCSTPWGDVDHFFRVLWTRGTDAPDAWTQSWHWPSSISPQVDDKLMAHWERNNPADYVAREFRAEWRDAAGAYFSSEDIEAAVDTRPQMQPAEARGRWAVGGVDWGQRYDASTLVTITIDEHATFERQHDVDRRDRRPVYRVAFLLEEYGKQYRDFIAQIVEAAHGFSFQSIVTETNGVGQMPSEELHLAMWKAVERANARPGVSLFASTPRMAEVPVVGLTTTAKTKADAFGLLRMLLQQRRLLVPDDPALLKQLRGLRSEELPAGGVRISVPESIGHDDLVMALALAAHYLVELEKTYTHRPPEADPAVVAVRRAQARLSAR
jgi:hypothetical protein